MKGYIQEGEIIELTAPYAVAAGAGALVGSIFGVAMDAVASGAVGRFLISGVVNITKEGAVSGQAWTEGAKLYWDNSNKRVTTTATSNSYVGVAVRQIDGTFPATTATTGTIRLNGIGL